MAAVPLPHHRPLSAASARATPRGRPPAGHKEHAWFHGVSVGEIHLLRQVVAGFRKRRPDWECVVSSTTDTGLDEARRCFADLPVIVWPLDFSWAVKRALDAVKPRLLVLAEGELWPNILRAAKARRIPVAVVNGRLSPKSARRYQRLGAFARPLFQSIDLFAVQTDEYAESLKSLGVLATKVAVTGSVKYDGLTCDRDNPQTAELGRLFNVESGDLVMVAGSTQAPEEKIVLSIWDQARKALSAAAADSGAAAEGSFRRSGVARQADGPAARPAVRAQRKAVQP